MRDLTRKYVVPRIYRRKEEEMQEGHELVAGDSAHHIYVGVREQGSNMVCEATQRP